MPPLADDELARDLHQLSHAEPRGREDAAHALGRALDPRSLGALVRALADESPKVAWASSTAIAKFGNSALDPLFALLATKPSGLAAASAARALGELGDARAIEPLVALLGAADPSTRSTSARALVRLGPSVVTHVAARLESGSDDEVGAAALALTGLSRGAELAAPALAAALARPDRLAEPPTLAVVAALGAIESPLGVGALLTAHEDDRPAVRDAARRALERLAVSDETTWQAATEGIASARHRLRWFEWAARAHVPWLRAVGDRALADETHLASLGWLTRYKYRHAVARLMKRQGSIAPRTTRWVLPAPSEPAAENFRLVSRYCALGEGEGGDVHEVVGTLTASDVELTAVRAGIVEWSIDPSQPFTLTLTVDRLDEAWSSPPLVSVHLRFEQQRDYRTQVEGGVSLHVLAGPEVEGLAAGRAANGYVDDAQVKAFSTWLAWASERSRR